MQSLFSQENGELIRKLRDLQKSNIRDIQDAASKAVFLLVDKDNRIKDGKGFGPFCFSVIGIYRIFNMEGLLGVLPWYATLYCTIRRCI